MIPPGFGSQPQESSELDYYDGPSFAIYILRSVKECMTIGSLSCTLFGS
jgi:hypothetical protein